MKIINKRARYDYELLDRYEAGIVLSGAEVKSCKLGHVSLSEAYVRIVDGQLSLINATISPYKFADIKDYDPTQSRKLLLHKRELMSIQRKLETKNLTIVPTAMYTKHRRVKLEIAIARGKKEFQKKEAKKRRDIDRETQRVLKQYQ